MKIDTFLCQLVLATLANTIAGFINRNSRDGKNPSKHGNSDFKMKTSFEIHWKTKSETIVWFYAVVFYYFGTTNRHV